MTKTHMSAARCLQDFAPEATLNVLGSCWTKPDGAGAKFYENVLSKLPKTVGECVEWAAALEQPLKAREVQAHLKWMFTSASKCLEVDGRGYENGSDDQPAEVTDGHPVVEAEVAEPVAKSKKTKRVKAAA